MLAINKTTITIAAGVAGTLLIGSCIYFIKKRRSDSNYKKKINGAENNCKEKERGAPNEMRGHNVPVVQEDRIFQNIQLGGQLMARCEYASAVEHFANALDACPQPQRLFPIFKTLVPAYVLDMLVLKLQERNYQISSQGGALRIISSPSCPVVPAEYMEYGLD